LCAGSTRCKAVVQSFSNIVAMGRARRDRVGGHNNTSRVNINPLALHDRGRLSPIILRPGRGRLLYQLVGAGEEVGRNCEPDGFGRLETDD
jgi:hypothetical protein